MMGVREVSHAQGQFLEWLRETKGFRLAQWRDDENLAPVYVDLNQLLAEFHGIDLNKVKLERRAILDAIRGSK